MCKYLLLSEFEVGFLTQARSARAISPTGKNLVRNFNEVRKIFIVSLGSKRCRLKQTFEFSGSYSAAKLTNHSARTN